MENGKPAVWDVAADIVFSRNILESLANRWERIAGQYMGRGLDQSAQRAMEIADRARQMIRDIG